MAEKTRKLPGIQPLDPADWLLRDEAFNAQMAYRDQLLAYSVEKLKVFPARHFRINGSRPCFTRRLRPGLGLVLVLRAF